MLKLAVQEPVPFDTEEWNWDEIRFKLENHLTLVNERHVPLHFDAASQTTVDTPTGTLATLTI